MGLQVQYAWSIAQIAVGNGATVKDEKIFALPPNITKPAGYVSCGSHAGTGTLDISLLTGDMNTRLGLSNFQHAVAFTQITAASANQINFQAASLTHQSPGCYGKINYTAVSTSGANTWDNVLIKFLAEVLS